MVDILAEVRAEMDLEKVKSSVETQDETLFIDMTIVQKLKAVESVIDEHIRPMLVMDGGNLEVLDIKDSDGNIDIYIRYLGACAGCATSSTGTLFAIESTLKSKLSGNIRVLPI